MPRLAIKPIVQDFKLEFATDDGEGDPIVVTVRQARTGDQIRLGNLFADQTQIWDDEEFGKIQLKRKWNPEELKRMRAYCTLAGSNLENEDGKELFPVRETSRGPELKLTQNEFFLVWDALPIELTNEIHRCILEMNPMWDFSNLGE